MKNKTKTILFITILSIAFIALLVAIINTLPMSYNELTQSAKKLESNHDYVIAVIGNGPPVAGSCVGHFVEITSVTPVDTAQKGGYVLYCIQHGTEFTNFNQYHNIAEFDPKYGTIDGGVHPWETYCPAHRPFEDLGEQSWPLLRCAGHTDYVSAGGDYIPGIGYAITAPSYQWNLPAQEAVWAFLGQGGAQNSIYQEGVKYQEFHDKTTDGGTHPKEPDIKIKDETDVNKITVKANNKEQTLTVGPFSIDYIYGYYKETGIAFGGISDMYMIGYNSKGQVIKDRIKVKKYFDPSGKGYELKKEDYFQPEQGTLVDHTKQVYPKGKTAGEETFQVQIDNPNAGLAADSNEDAYVAKVKLHIEFQWMGVTEATVCKTNAFRYEVSWKCDDHPNHCHHSHTSACYTSRLNCSQSHSHTSSCYTSYLVCDHSNGCPKTIKCKDCNATSWLTPIPVQKHFSVILAQRQLFKAEIEIPEDIEIPITMDLGGKVWEDVPEGKESKADGKYTEADRVIPNVRVTLFEQNGTKAVLLSNAGEARNDADLMSRVNSTYTDERGDYLFKGLDPLKKYYVQFEYNGQVYLPTDYNLNLADYNQQPWEIASKGTETPADRDSYDQTYAEIGSAPANYKVPANSLKIATLKNGYNESFSQYDLMGFEMTENGDYVERDRLIDSFFHIENGEIKEVNTIQEGRISKEIKNFIKANRKSPTDSELVGIYQKIAGGNQETLRKLQFIEDTYINSYTQAQGAGRKDLYPVYDQFIVNKTINMKYDNAEQARNQSYDMKIETLDGVTYRPIYPGQFYINQGLWRRQETDLSLRKDALYAATRINGKTEVYEYNKRDQYTQEQKDELKRLRKIYEENGRKPEDYQRYLNYKTEIENNNSYWQIQLRMRDYNNYYGTIYTKELYQADYNYRSMNTNWAGATPEQNKDLELYVTYKITVRNASQSILDEVTEIVDFYDKDYTYRDDLSWVMYKSNSNSTTLESIEEIAFTETDYYNTIHNLSLQGNIQKNNKGTNSSSNSQYETRTSEVRSDITDNYNDVYIKGLAGKKLISGEEAYVYLTFKVNSDDKGPVILDEDDSLKYNYAEINGYKTFYRDGTTLPNGITKGSRDAAGIMDINSTPGNLCKKDLQGNKYEKNFENDTDRAKGIKVTVDEEFIRSINGTVWEDERTKNVSNSLIGDGVRTNEIGVRGATVELVEKLERGGEYVWQRTTTDSSGKYEFKTDKDLGIFIIPGNYIVRFHYGDTTATVQTNQNGGGNVTSYNGQDFKSTVYQKDMNGGEVGKVADQYYDIRSTDAFGKNISDAKDLYTKKTETVIDRLNGNKQSEVSFLGREDVIGYSNKAVTNHKAEVMASPYESPKDSSLINELMQNTNMTAETAIIVLEGEYNRTGTDGYKTESNNVNPTDFLFGNDKNGNYTLNNVDLGITERPKAGLELNKKITNIKLTLANGNVLFDAVKSMNDLSWMAGSPYKLDEEGNRNKNNKYQEFYKANNRYTYRTERGTAKYSVDGLVASKFDSSGNNGLIQIIMDEELMHGATIRISYDLTVTNVGEKDFEGQDFYYKGTNANKVVTTAADVVLDYVANNLQFREADNANQNGWKAVNNVITTTGINRRLAQSVAKYNTVIQTANLNKALTPKEKGSQEANYSTKAGLVLTQLITPENNQDDKTYNNIAEITTITNTVGRRMAYSVQGNQDPLNNPQEVDSFKSEQVVILPPYGSGNWIIYVVLTAGVLAILATGIILIKKKVLKK